MLQRRFDIAPEPKVAIQLTLVLWLAASMIVTLGAILSGSMYSLAEYLTVPLTVVSATAIAMTLYGTFKLVHGKPAFMALPCIIVAVVIAALLQTGADYGVQHVFHGIFSDHVMPDTGQASVTVAWAVYLGLFSCNAALLWISFIQQKSKLREIALARTEADLAIAEMQNSQAQLKMLRLQLDPHFMVNSLNALATMVMTDGKPQALEMTDRLAEFLRLSLEMSDTMETSLGDEIALTAAYIDIEAIRFHDRLDVEIDCPPDLGLLRVPSFLLQPLVENAMKHGIGRSSGAARLSINARAEGGNLVLTVDNVVEEAAEGSDSAAGLGLGLRNTRQRLQTRYNGQAALMTAQIRNGFRSQITLPMNMLSDPTPSVEVQEKVVAAFYEKTPAKLASRAC